MSKVFLQILSVGTQEHNNKEIFIPLIELILFHSELLLALTTHEMYFHCLNLQWNNKTAVMSHAWNPILETFQIPPSCAYNVRFNHILHENQSTNCRFLAFILFLQIFENDQGLSLRKNYMKKFILHLKITIPKASHL